MDKIAQLKHAEVAGVISGLIDGGYLKLASDQEFEALTEAVAGSISNNWDLGEVLDKTAEIVEYASQEPEAVEKTAYDLLADYGYLCLAKEAGDITEEEFAKEAAATYKQLLVDKIMDFAGKGPVRTKLLEDAVSGAKYVQGKGKKFMEALTFKPMRDNTKFLKRMDNTGMGNYSHKDSLHKVPESLKAWGGVAGTGAGLYGLNKLRDKDNRDEIAKRFKAGKKAILG